MSVRKRLFAGGAAAAAVAPRLRRGLMLAAVAGLGACGILDDDQTLPSVARVDLAGSSPVDLEMVVSDDFQRVDDFTLGARYNVLVQSDTLYVRPEFAREYDISVTRRFLVRLTNHSSEVASVTLSVAFDGEVEYSQRANIAEGGALEFSEIFFGT